MRTKIIYIYMCSIIIEFVFSNNFNNEEIFINDRRQKISSLNSLVIVNFEKNFLNDSKKINTFKKVIEYNVQQSKFFKLVNTTINEKDLKKHFNPIHGSKLSKTKKSKLKRQLNKKNIKNSIDVIFQIFSKNGKDLYLTIINTNNKELVRSSLNLKTNIFDINEEQLNAKVNILFKEILDNYFYRSVIISDRKNIDKYTIHINGNKSLPNLNIINNISRYNDVNIYFSNKDSISEKIYLKKANFILNNKNTKISQNVKQNFIEKKCLNLDQRRQPYS